LRELSLAVVSARAQWVSPKQKLARSQNVSHGAVDTRRARRLQTRNWAAYMRLSERPGFLKAKCPSPSCRAAGRHTSVTVF